MKEKKPTPLEVIYKDTEVARTAYAKKNKVRLGRDIKDLAADMLLVANAIVIDLEKFLSKGMQAPAKRIRRGTKSLQTLSAEFRVKSVKIKKYE